MKQVNAHDVGQKLRMMLDGYLQGEDAVYKMLHWIFGTYEFNHRLIAPQGKLDTNLWELINEGLRKTFVYHRFKELEQNNN